MNKVYADHTEKANAMHNALMEEVDTIRNSRRSELANDLMKTLYSLNSASLARLFDIIKAA